jgi:glycosyltransferase involved in cell wall biosynthesis
VGACDAGKRQDEHGDAVTIARAGPRPLEIEARAKVPTIAVVIPCFRVARQVSDVVRSIPKRYTPVICVDDASPDDVRGALRALNDPRVVYVRHGQNRGVGGAVMTGWKEALARGADIVVKMDGDGQMTGEHLDSLVAPLTDGSVDVAKGNRFVDHVALRTMPATRLVGNALLSFVVKAVSGYWNVLDPTNGFIGVRSDLLRRLDQAWLAERYYFETSLLVALNVAHARVADVALPARYVDAPSSLHVGRVAASFPWLLARSLARRFYWRYLIEDFGVVSLGVLLGIPLTLFGTAFGAWHWVQSVRTGVPATAGTVFVAALPIILGVQLLLVALVLDVLSSPSIKRGSRTGEAADRA